MSIGQGDTLIYCRVSEHTTRLDSHEDRQTRWQTALDLQRRQCEEFAVQFGYQIAGSVAEIFDGLDSESEGLNELYAYGESGAIKYVLVTDPPRLSFDKEAQARILSRLAGLGMVVLYAAM